MRQRHIMNGFDMEQPSHPNIPPINPVPTFQHFDNNSMFNPLPQYPHPPPPPPHPPHLGPAMSTPPSLHLPYEPFHAPPSHPLAPVGHESNPHFMGHGYKRKSSEATPGNYQYVTESAAPSCSFPPETAPYTFPHYPTTYSQPIDQRSVRSRVAGAAVTMNPPPHPYSQVNYGPHPFPPPAPIWYDQHVNNDNTSSSSFWLQPPPSSVPFIHGNAVDSGNVCLPRFHEASSSRNNLPVAYPMPNYLSHHPPPPTVYPRMASASSYTVHDGSYMRPVQPTGLRISHLYPRDDFFPAATLRHSGLTHLGAIPAYEDEGFGEEDLYDDVDDHQDMRLDIEGMSYEELLALSDNIGTVKTGLSEETVKDLVRRRTSVSTRINLEEAPPSTDLETDSCTICQENYKNQDRIATLDCKHEYHAECLEKWLVIKNLCPICKSEALKRTE